MSKNKSLESVNSGDLVMIGRTSNHDPPLFGLVISLENQGRDGTIQLKSGYRLVTSVGNLVSIGTGAVSLIPAFSAVEQELKQLNTTDQWHMVGMLIISGVGSIGNIDLTWKLKQLGKRLGRDSQYKEQV